MALKKLLGRVQPRAIIDMGNVKAVISPTGQVRYVPKFSFHYNRERDKNYHFRASAAPVTNWIAKMGPVVSQTYGNTQQGDCVIASLLHRFGGWTANETGTPALSSDAEALQTYVKVCGPGDQGCVIADVLDYAQKNGVPLSGVIHKIGGYAAIDNMNQNEVQVCAQVFGPSMPLGLNLPQAWYDSANGNGFVWDNITGNFQVAGGHDVPIIDVNAQGVVILTWGMYGTITWAALANTKIVTEAYVNLAPDWSSQNNLAPNGINAATLAADLAIVQSGGIPPAPSPDPNPPSPPVPPIPPNPPTPTTGVVSVDTAKNNVDVPDSTWTFSVAGSPVVAGGISPAIQADLATLQAAVSQLVTDAGAKSKMIAMNEVAKLGWPTLLAFLKLIADIRAKAPAATIQADEAALAASIFSEPKKTENSTFGFTKLLAPFLIVGSLIVFGGAAPKVETIVPVPVAAKEGPAEALPMPREAKEAIDVRAAFEFHRINLENQHE